MAAIKSYNNNINDNKSGASTSPFLLLYRSHMVSVLDSFLSAQFASTFDGINITNIIIISSNGIDSFRI